jgi:hypothetical protein
MDATIQERHRQRVAALTAPPRVGQVVAWDAHYAADAVLVTPDGQLLRGVADIASFLGDETIRPVELELLQADRVGATGYAVATYKTAEKPPRSGTAFTLYTTGPAAALLISVDIYGGALLPRALDEWKECRSSIDRFDKLMVDVRKYGFTLITGLLAATAFAFVKLDGAPPVDVARVVPDAARAFQDAARVGVSLVLMVLVFGLFTVDRYIEMFLRAAVTRARALEAALDLRLTYMISSAADGAQTSTWATWLYTLFMLCAIVPWIVSTAQPWHSPLTIVVTPGPSRVVTVIGLAFTVLLWIYHAWTRLGLRAGLESTTKLRVLSHIIEARRAAVGRLMEQAKVRFGL